MLGTPIFSNWKRYSVLSSRSHSVYLTTCKLALLVTWAALAPPLHIQRYEHKPSQCRCITTSALEVKPHFKPFVGKYTAVTSVNWSIAICGAAWLCCSRGVVTEKICSHYMLTGWWMISPMASLYHPATRAVTWSANLHAHRHTPSVMTQRQGWARNGTSLNIHNNISIHNRKKQAPPPPPPHIKNYTFLQRDGFSEKLFSFSYGNQ